MLAYAIFNFSGIVFEFCCEVNLFFSENVLEQPVKGNSTDYNACAKWSDQHCNHANNDCIKQLGFNFKFHRWYSLV